MSNAHTTPKHPPPTVNALVNLFAPFSLKMNNSFIFPLLDSVPYTDQCKGQEEFGTIPQNLWDSSKCSQLVYCHGDRETQIHEKEKL